MRKYLIIFLFSMLVLFSLNAYSQCSMCRRVAETSQSEGNKSGRSLNKGILYLLSVPYLMAGIGAFIWWRNRKKQ
jgi:hypothetical protein